MATRWSRVPGGDDDVIERSREDVGKVRKGLNVDKSDLKGGARDAVREAGSRAGARLINRAGAAQLALTGGYEAGRALDEKTGIGKKMVEKSGLGSAAEKAASRRDKVELSKSAKERLDDEEVDRYRRETDASEKARREYSGRYEDGTRLPDEESYKGDDMKKGGRVKKMASGGMTASQRADGIATRGKTKCKMY